MFSEAYVKHTTIGNQQIVFVAFNLTDPTFDTHQALAFTKRIEKKPGEFFVAMVHGGDEYKLTSNAKQQTLYRGLIDAGVDVVVAHHPHVTEEVELYHGKPIFYSLGNFIFDQYFQKEVEEGLAVKLTLSASEATYELLPIKGNHSQPALMEDEQKAVFLTDVAKRSPTATDAVAKGEIIISR
jgi:poly-gamma-glutamate synthesis protein (capsule biosynthesis protein)